MRYAHHHQPNKGKVDSWHATMTKKTTHGEGSGAGEEDEHRPRRRDEEKEDEEDLEPWPRQSIRRIDRRVYVHDECDGETIISGKDFERLANPFQFVSQAYCAACEKYTGLGRFYWANTGESIRDYRQRLRRLAPVSLKVCCYVVAPLVLAVVVAIAAGITYVVADERETESAGGDPYWSGLHHHSRNLLITPLLAWMWGIDYRQYR